MTLGDHVAVMKRGVLQQVASPQSLYARPVNLFVAGFIGSPAMNLVEDLPLAHGGRHVRRVRRPALQDYPPRSASGLAGYRDRPIVLGIRPENMEDGALVSSSDPDSRSP